MLRPPHPVALFGPAKNIQSNVLIVALFCAGAPH